jgi:hypothetical protein
LTFGKEENGSPIAPETMNDNRIDQTGHAIETNNSLAKAAPITMGSGILKLVPMEVIIGIKIREATVCETKVATVQQKNRTQIKAQKALSTGNTINQGNE